MFVDIETVRWRSRDAAEIVGFDHQVKIREWRKDYGLTIGKLRLGDWRYSVLDIADLTAAVTFWKLGFAPGAAVKLAHEFTRDNLRDVLTNRLVHGFWSAGAIEIPAAVDFAKRVVFLDQVAERVIDKLKLPLPAKPMPRTPQIALRMSDAIFDYVMSTAGRERWRKWHESAVARGGKIPMSLAAVELGAPLWWLRVLDGALRSAEVKADPALIAAVRPKAAKIADDLEGVTLQ